MQDDQLARIIEQLSAEPEEAYTLQQVVDQAVANIPGCHMCSVFVRRHGTVEVAASSDPVASRVDDLQFAFEEGPCLDVLAEHEIATVRDTGHERRWPDWADAAHEEGVRSSLSVRLSAVAPYFACLNMYSHDEDGFDQDALDRAVVYARLASVALEQAREITGLRSALHNRLIIGAAQGILMERYGLTLDRAFEVLRRHSNESNTKLRDVAQGVLDGVGQRSPQH
ncbi:GAF and ANTAR domain-containing protein [Janibacter alittae]|uniref:GAF and ANTAR domain-containing protein n=1 Tax=Janibacter alittae TaxID=3115209 RepID=A0ABZ2MLD3_9MICO